MNARQSRPNLPDRQRILLHPAPVQSYHGLAGVSPGPGGVPPRLVAQGRFAKALAGLLTQRGLFQAVCSTSGHP
jgi:hypothetical protein